MKVTFIANPYAGRWRARRFFESFLEEADELGRDAEVKWTEGPGHAVLLARESRSSADVVVAVGGDGTVHEVVGGLMPDPCPLVIVPSGTGNDFAGLLGCPRTPADLVRVLDDGIGARVDVIRCDGLQAGVPPGGGPGGGAATRYAVNNVGMGFEAYVNLLSRSITRLGGLALYLVAVFKALRAFDCPPLALSFDGGAPTTGDRLMVSIGNGVSSGGGFHLTPDARPDDGQLDACIVQRIGRARILTLLPTAIKGNHVHQPEVTMRRSSELTVTCSRPFHMHIDGEYAGFQPGPLQLSVQRGVLPVLCDKQMPHLLSAGLTPILSGERPHP